MTQLAAIQGVFADFKTVKTRSTVQIVIELPIERGKEALDILGFPQPGQEIPVVIARLDPNMISPASPSSEQGETAGALAPTTPERQPPSKRWSELPYSSRAAMLCDEDEFAEFLAHDYPDAWASALHNASGETADAAAIVVRALCGVTSRADITPGSIAAGMFDQLDTQYGMFRRYGQ